MGNIHTVGPNEALIVSGKSFLSKCRIFALKLHFKVDVVVPAQKQPEWAVGPGPGGW